MKRLFFWFLAGLGVIQVGAATEPSLPSLDAFFSLPNVRDPQLSPDGTKIAFLTPYEHRMAIGLFDRKTQAAQIIVHGVDESIADVFWKGNDCLVFRADVGGDESFFIGSTDLEGKKINRLVESFVYYLNMADIAASLVDPLPLDPDHIVLSGAYGSDEGIVKVDVRHKGSSQMYLPERGDLSVVLDHHAVVRMKARLVNKETIWSLRANSRESFKDIIHFPAHGVVETWQPLAFAADNITLYVISREENDRGALYTYNTATHQQSPALFVPPTGEIVSLIFSQDRTKLYGVSYEDERLHYHWFDDVRAKLQTKLEHTFPDRSVSIVSRSADERVSIVLVSSDRDPGAYYILDNQAGTLALFKRIRDIDTSALRPMTPIAFRARDGLEVHGYLTLPAGAEGKRVPLIVHPHGGPYGFRDGWGYNGEVQFLASRGYAVLQINYRGSGGYGREFIDRGRYQWGRAMQDDLTDGVKWAVEQGFADPDRIAIYGASYGGYAALAGAIFTPDLYRCAVNYVGVSDINFLNTDANTYYHSNEFNYIESWVGPDKAYRDATSPVNFVERIRIPTLHAYGKNDPRVQFKHWTRLEAELKKYKKPYVAIVEEKQGHGFRQENASQKFYGALEKFLAENLGPGVEARAAEQTGKKPVADSAVR